MTRHAKSTPLPPHPTVPHYRPSWNDPVLATHRVEMHGGPFASGNVAGNPAKASAARSYVEQTTGRGLDQSARQGAQASRQNAATSPNGTVPARQGQTPFRGKAPPATVYDRGLHPKPPRHGR